MSKELGNLALDTNAVIAYLADNASAAAWVESASGLFVPVICVGELEYGARHSANPKKNLRTLDAFLQNCTVLQTTRRTASGYGIIRQSLAEKGKPIPEADLWIAAICWEHSFPPLLSEDQHFDAVPNVVRFDWHDPVPRSIQRPKRR